MSMTNDIDAGTGGMRSLARKAAGIWTRRVRACPGGLGTEGKKLNRAITDPEPTIDNHILSKIKEIASSK
jgi:hypothetical protein